MCVFDFPIIHQFPLTAGRELKEEMKRAHAARALTVAASQTSHQYQGGERRCPNKPALEQEQLMTVSYFCELHNSRLKQDEHADCFLVRPSRGVSDVQ